jgi:Fe-S oxidoreductase
MAPTGSILGQLLLLALIAGAFGLFGWRLARLYRLVRAGAPEDRRGAAWPRLRRVAALVLGQTKLFEQPGIGLAHFVIFWGFIILTAGAIERLLAGVLGGFRLPLLGRAHWFIALNDALAAAVILSVGYAAVRRLGQRPWYLTSLPDSFIILAAIGGHLSALLLSEGFAAAAFGTAGEYWSPAGLLLGGPLGALGPAAAAAGYAVTWWADILLILGLLTYIPLSKHLHILTAPVNVYLTRNRPAGELRPLDDLETAERFGVSEVRQFTWKDLLDVTACTECGRCTRACPATLTGKPLDPKQIVVDIKRALYAEAGLRPGGRGPEPAATAGTPLVGGLIDEAELWACTTCYACVEACPVAIEQAPKIVDLRRALVLEESRFPPELNRLYTNLERHGNPFGARADQRADWARGLGLRVAGEPPGRPIDLLYWVGCYGSFDARNQRVAHALARVLAGAGVDAAILGVAERCTGDPARRTGNEYLYQVLAEGNVATLARHGVRRIVTACPHCFNTLAHEYPRFGGRFEVVHHSQFIAELLQAGRLRLAGGTEQQRLTFHDPCYLGRYNGVYEPPRAVLAGLAGAEVREMRRSRQKALCCGGGGGRAFMEERLGTKMSHNRLGDVLATGAETLAAACPFCITMFEDGIRTGDAGGQVQVADLAELVAARLAAEPEQGAP